MKLKLYNAQKQSVIFIRGGRDEGRSIKNKNDVLKQIPVKGWIALAAKNCPSPRQLILGFLSSQLAAGLAICCRMKSKSMQSYKCSKKDSSELPT